MSPFAFLFKKEKKRHDLLGKRQGEQGVLEDGAQLLKETISSCDGRGCYPIRMFCAKEIEEAIKDPCPNNPDWIYKAYEGTHQDRQIIIKVYQNECMLENHRQLAFTEIATVTQINHGNVTKLLGCCFEMGQPILIYEKVPFILHNCLFEANPSTLIPWENRLRIAIEMAYAITYLHIGTSRPIVHRHIKCSSILLDENYKPKLADFSFSKTIPLGETDVPTCVVVIPEYLPPEYRNTSNVNEKSDVYSYGVVLLELLSGKRIFDPIEMEPVLLEFVKKESTEKEERLEMILEKGLLMDDRKVEEAMAFIEVAVGCISTNPDERPTIKEVAQQLEQIERAKAVELPPPTPIFFFVSSTKTWEVQAGIIVLLSSPHWLGNRSLLYYELTTVFSVIFN